MNKVVLNIFLTLVAVVVVGFLFYVGAMEAKGTPTAMSSFVSECFK